MKPSTVSKTLQQIKSSLESEYRNLSICGEVSNLSRSGSGHIYFSLSDEQSSLGCALFRMDAMRNPDVKKIKNGDQIVCFGSIGVYTKRGTFQLVVKRVEMAGRGRLQDELVRLKERLSKEGLFDIATKKKVPTYPKKIGLVTAEKSAAYYDFINVYKRRSLWMDVVYVPALVQGEKAPESLRASLNRLIKYHLNSPENKLDAIVLTRGGGSLEDLWSFNDEGLAWDIYNCPVPVISAVGHDVDFSISDYVADTRCETPTAAAEFLTKGQMEIKSSLTHARSRLQSHGREVVHRHRQDLMAKNPYALLNIIKTKLAVYKSKLDKLNLIDRIYDFTNYHDNTMRLEELYNGLLSYQHKIALWKEKLERLDQVIMALGPQNVLKRGYSFVKDENDDVIASHKSFQALAQGSRLKIYFHNGSGDVVKK